MLRRKLLCLYARGLSTASAATRPRMPRISFPKRIAADGSRLSLHKGELASTRRSSVCVLLHSELTTRTRVRRTQWHPTQQPRQLRPRLVCQPQQGSTPSSRSLSPLAPQCRRPQCVHTLNGQR